MAKLNRPVKAPTRRSRPVDKGKSLGNKVRMVGTPNQQIKTQPKAGTQRKKTMISKRMTEHRRK